MSKVKGDLVGVYAANDGTAGGAIAALKGGGVDPLPPVTGQDAELAAIQRIISGDRGHDDLQGHQAGGRGRRQGGHRPR
ncbi:substrate-binding domain-containing protein [Janibacter limosus]|uniref:substrate-binding domain-containing protein n=1 Tax=Janibacter limosus TaxID=53458 RepID=UPI002153A31F|nr:substrate-binding domain-containing protein [Janibacter limosus]WKV16689.1 substrate-binding domain-containing protein [Janibacter limosus]